MSRLLRGILIATVLCIPSTATAAAAPTWQEIGTSQQGNPIRALRIGDPDAELRIVVLGQMHGDEPAGRRVTQALARFTPPPGTAIWVIPSMNPDGHRDQTRTNARGVDLNRNFPIQWRSQAAGTRQWSGPSAASEPETQVIMRFLSDVQPTALLSFHQPFGVVDITHAPARQAGRKLARWMGLPARVVGCSGPCRGTLTEWATEELGAIAITVELPARVQRRDIDRAASATLKLARWLAPVEVAQN